MIQCTYCGRELPRDDARFCNNCGTLVSSHLLSSQSLTASKSTSAPLGDRVGGHDQKRNPPVLREQIAQQPPRRVTRRIAPKLDQSLAEQPTISWPAPVTHVSVHKATSDIGDLPTGVLATAPDTPRQSQRLPLSTQAELEKGDQRQHKQYDDVDQFDTVPTVTYRADRVHTVHTPHIADTQNTSSSSEVRPVAQQPSPLVEPMLPPRTTSSAGVQRKGARSGGVARLVFVLLLIMLGVIGAGVGWIFAAQPFSVPPVTQPQQRFQDTRFGVSLSYPTGWVIQKDVHDPAVPVVHFYDSSHTAQVNLVVSANGDANQYLQQQAIQAGMTGTRQQAPLSFARSSWQQVQGTVQQNGASYTETMFATVHGNHLYLFTQLAPQSVYADEERVVFVDIRSSLQFLS